MGNRLLILMVPQQRVLSLLAQALDLHQHGFVRPVDRVRIPDDAEVLAVQYDYMRRAFAFTLQHHTFPPVADGALLPVLDPYLGQLEYARCPGRPTDPSPFVVVKDL